MSSLYELSKGYRELLAKSEAEAINSDGEISEVTVSLLEASELAISDKIENSIRYYKNLIAEADALKAEKQKLQHREKIARNKAERLVKYLSDCDAVGFSCAAGEVKSRTTKVVSVDEFTDLSAEYLRVKSEPNLVALKDALKKGVEIDGVKLVESVKVSVK